MYGCATEDSDMVFVISNCVYFFDLQELDHTVTYADFETMRGDDPRFQALEKKEREALLHER